MTRHSFALGLVAALSSLQLACSHGPSIGSEGGACYGNNTCDVGLTCLSDLCVHLPDAAVPDADPTGGDALAIDAMPDASPLVCNDDSDYEPNDAISTALVTGIPTFRSCESYVNLAICPSTDTDVFSFGVETNGKHLRATITTNVPAGELTLQVLNATGALIANGSVADPSTITVVVNNLAVGMYYVRIGAPTDSGVQNNYDLDILTCDVAGCPDPCAG